MKKYCDIIYLKRLYLISIAAVMLLSAMLFVACDNNGGDQPYNPSVPNARYVIVYHFNDDEYSELYTGDDYTFFMPTYDTFVCEGWTLYEQSADMIDYDYLASRRDSSDLHLYVRWQTKSGYAKLSFDCNGGSDIDPIFVVVGSTVEELPTTQREGYNFLGWYYDHETLLTPFYVSSSTVDEDVTIKAKWSIDDNSLRYTLVFDSMGGSDVEAISLPPAGFLTRDPETYREGYKFVGWYIDSTYTVKYPYDTLINQSYYLYALWEPTDEKVTLTFDYCYDGILREMDFAYSARLQASDFPTPTRDGYDFFGWYNDEEYTAMASVEIYLTEPLTFYAQWQPKAPENKFTVTFWLRRSDKEYEIRYIDRYATDYAYTPTTTDEVTFVGWYADPDCEQPFDFSHPLSSAMAVYAKWSDSRSDLIETDGVFQYRKMSGSDIYYEVVKFVGSGKATMPKSFNGYDIGNILSDAFAYTDVTEIDFNRGLAEIPDGLFKGSKLTSLIIPDYIRVIGKEAFADCVDLVTVEVQTQAPLSQSTFSGCTSLTTVTLTATDTLPAGVFAGCSSLSSIVSATKVATIEREAFVGCSSLSAIDFWADDATVAESAFIDTGITSLTLSGQNISSGAFVDCHDLTTVALGAEAQGFRPDIFKGCDGITAFSVEEGNELFVDFDGCLYMMYEAGYILICYPYARADSDYTLPDQCAHLMIGSFEGTLYLETLNIGDSLVSTLGNFLFGSSISRVNVADTNTHIRCENGVIYDYDRSTVYGYVSDSAAQLTLADTVQTISDYAFCNDETLQSITIPASVAKIDYYTFVGLSSLTEVVFAGDVQLSEFAFVDCAALTKLSFDRIIEVHERALSGTAITTMTLGNVVGLYSYSLSEMTSLTDVTLGDSIYTLSAGAFYGCSSLSEVTIGGYLHVIEGGAFAGTALQKLVLTTDSAVVDIAAGDYSNVDLFVPEALRSDYLIRYSTVFKSISSIE